MLHTHVSAGGAGRLGRQVNGAIEILEHKRDRLIPLVVEGPLHLRSRRLRQLISIERLLVAAQQARPSDARAAARN